MHQSQFGRELIHAISDIEARRFVPLPTQGLPDTGNP